MLLKKLRHSRITSSSCSHNTRVELGLRVRDNTRVELDVRLNRVGPFRERCVGFRGVGNVDLGLRVDMLGGNPRMARGYGTPRGRRVDKGPVHLDSNPRMARGFGAPRGRRVETVPK